MDPNLLGVRDTLNKQFGIDNNRIGYNANNGMVQVDGQDVFKPQSNEAGTTYAGQDQFNSAAGKLNQLNNTYKLQQQVLNPQQQNPNPYTNQVSDLLGRLKTIGQQQPLQLSDVYNSPQYAAAKQQQQLDAQQGISAGQEALGAAGMARSSDLAQYAQNVQNKANLNLETQTVPQIMSMLQGQREQQYNNAANLLGQLTNLSSNYDTLQNNRFAQAMEALKQMNAQTQQGFENQLATRAADRADQAQQLNQTQTMAQLTGRMPDGSQTNAAQQQQLANEWTAAEQLGTITPTLANLYGIPEGTPTMQAKQLAMDMAYKNASLGIEGMNAQTSLMNAQTNKEQADYQVDPNSPHNQYYKSLASYKDASSNNLVDKAYYDAVSAAQKDPLFNSYSPEQQQTIINQYYQQLKGASGGAPAGGNNGSGLSDADIAQYLK